MALFSWARRVPDEHNQRVQGRLAALATQVEVITRQIRTLGLSRAAEDLHKVSAELRRLEGEASDCDAREDEGPVPPHGTSGRAT